MNCRFRIVLVRRQGAVPERSKRKKHSFCGPPATSPWNAQPPGVMNREGLQRSTVPVEPSIPAVLPRSRR
jgi:hypothetical protein